MEFENFYVSEPILSEDKTEEIGIHLEETNVEIFGEDEDYAMISLTDWNIYPNGTFDSDTERSWESWDIPRSGTFDSAKYDEIVSKIKREDMSWQEELSYDPFDYEID